MTMTALGQLTFTTPEAADPILRFVRSACVGFGWRRAIAKKVPGLWSVRLFRVRP